MVTVTIMKILVNAGPTNGLVLFLLSLGKLDTAKQK